MANKRYSVELGVSANVSQAQAQLLTLQTTLKNIANTGASNLPLNDSLKKAVESAKTLQTHLNKAFNQSTGNIDLGRLQNSLSASGDSLTKLSKNLLNAGTTGEKSFVALQNSITNANVKLTQSQSLMESFAISLKNAAKWQLSSSILHGFMGSLQTAYGYAQDLNESLNNIRIVTGYGADKMASFALEANKAAQALSTTTTKYTDASLIFYQQGLSDKEVLARTETAIKLANVSRQSTQEVSDQMTAIWNNFYDGSKSLEYYADAITALGAKTASSSDEIATGLSKFAAIGDTVGLSYEYATASLATITAQTRQSADVVGNALKTLFARIQGLKMDEKQEDGTDFNKYSKALLNVGVSVKDANGQLKEMDQILDELGARWDSLSKNQQMATAQTVAGVRQYTQLIALMDNWDIMQENVAIAKNSTGTLQEQADIYAESWEASRDRVRAALESIYGSLVDDRFFISMNDNLAKVINGVDNVVKSLGGFKGALLLIANIFLTQFQGEIVAGLQNLGVKFQQVGINISNIGKNVDESASRWEKFKGIVSDTLSVFDTSKIFSEDLKNSLTAALATAPTESMQGYIKGLQEINAKKAEILSANDLLNSSEKQILETHLQQLTQLNEEVRLTKQKTEEAENYFSALQLASVAKDRNNKYISINSDGKAEFLLQTQNLLNKETQEYIDLLGQAVGVSVSITQAKVNEKTEAKLICDTETDLKILRDQILAAYRGTLVIQGQSNAILNHTLSMTEQLTKNDETRNTILAATRERMNEIVQAQVDEGRLTTSQVEKIQEKINALDGTDQSYKQLLATVQDITQKHSEQTGILNSNQEILDKIRSLATEEVNNWQNIAGQQAASKNVLEQIDKIMNSVQSRSTGLAGTFTAMIRGASSLAMSINTVKNSWEQFNREDASVVDKLVSGTMLLTAATRGLSTAFSGAVNFINLFITASKGAAAATELQALKQVSATAISQNLQTAMSALTTVKQHDIAVDLKRVLVSDQCTKARLSEILMSQMGLKQAEAEAVADQLLTKRKEILGAKIKWAAVEKELYNITTDAATKKTIEEKIATDINTASKKKNAAAQALLNLKMIAAIAIIAALAIAIKKAVDAYNADAKAAEDAAKAADKLKQAAEETTDKLNKIKDTVSGYNEAVTALQNCTKGTEEWNAALGEVQDKVTQLLHDFPELLSNANLFNADGTLNTDVLNDAVSNAQRAAENADAAALWGQVGEYRARAESAITNLSRGSSRYAQYSGEGENKVEIGRDRDKAEQDVKLIADNMDKIKMAGSTAESVLHVLGISVDKTTGTFTDAQKAFAESLLATAQSYLQATTAANNASQIITNAWAENKKIALEASEEKIINSLQTQNYDKYAKSLEATNEKNSTAILGAEFDDSKLFSGKTIAQAFNIARGTDYDLASGGVSGSGADKKYTFVEEGGEKQDYTFKEMQEAIAAAAALEKLTESATIVSNMMSTIAAQTNVQTAEGINSWMANGNFANITPDSLAALQTSIGNSDISEYLASVSGQSAEQLANMFGVNFADNFSKAMIDQQTGLTELMDSWNVSWKDASGRQKSSNIVKDYLVDSLHIREQDFKDITYQSQTEFAKAYRSIFEQGGKEGLEAVGAILNKAKDDSKDFAEVVDLFSSTDWSNWDSISALKDELASLGITIDDSLIQKVLEANHVAAGSGDAIVAKFSEVSGIIQDLQIGDIVSPDDFAKIEAMGVDVDHFFTKMADGTYKLTEDADVFYDTVMGKYRSDLLESMQGQKNDISNIREQQEDVGILDATKYNKISHSAYTGQNDINGNMIIDQQILSDQLALITQMRTANEDMLASWRDSLESNNLTAEDLTQIADAARQAGDQFNGLNEKVTTINTELAVNQERYLASAQSLTEFDMLVSQLANNIGMIDLGAYSNALVALASQYENCTDEIDEYNRALKSNNQETIKAAESNLRLAISAGEVAKKYNLSAEDVETQARLLQKSFRELSKGMEMSNQQAVSMAAANQRMNRGVSTLNQNFNNWKKTLTSAKKTSQEYASTLNDTYDALADLAGCIDAADIPLDFLNTTTAEGAEHMEWLERAAMGDVTAINLLGTELAMASVEAMTFDANLASAENALENTKNIAEAWGADWTNAFTRTEQALNTYKTNVIAGIQNLQDEIRKGNVQAGEEITNLLNVNGQNWVENLNKLALATGMTVDQMNEFLNGIGVQTEVNTIEQVQHGTEPMYQTFFGPGDTKEVQQGENPDGTPKMVKFTGIKYWTEITGDVPVDRKVQVAQIKASGNTSIPDSPQLNFLGTASVGSSSGSKGIGSIAPGLNSSSISNNSGRGGGDSTSRKKPSSNSSTASKTPTPTKPKEPTVTTNEADPAEAKKEFTRYDEAVGRYHRIEDALDNLARAADKAAKSTDKLYGIDKLNALTRENKLLQNNIWLLGQKKAQAEKYFDFDKNNMEKQLGVVKSLVGEDEELVFKYSLGKDPTDPGKTNGDILNYNELEAKIREHINAREAYYNNPANFPTYSTGVEEEYDDEGNKTSTTYNEGGGLEDQEAWKEKNLDPLVEAFNLLKEYVNQYNETKEIIQDTNEQMEEAADGIRERNAKKIQLLFETHLEVNDRDRAILDWMASRVSDNVYTKIEFITTQMGVPFSELNLGEGTGTNDVFWHNQYVKDLMSNLDAAEKSIGTLDKALENNWIAPEAYIEGMRNANDSIMENVDSLREYDAMMRTLYADTIPKMTEEIDRYTDSMEYCTSVLNHYENIASLLNGFVDYDWEATLYEGMLRTLESRWKAADGEYKLWKPRVDELAESVTRAQQRVNEARASGNADAIAEAEEALNLEKKNYDEAVKACEDAYDQRLTLAANYIEVLKKKYTSQIKDIFSKAEREAFGGYSMDEIKTNMERLKAVQENYLNGQEKAYEINKMLRKMNQDMSKTQNKQAQEQIKAFQQETLALGNRERLSRYELEIQQKRYDLLLAQQGLLEVENAKTHVTLRRDEEGNYGYIYTADQTQIDQANQNYEDKYYALFETVLSGYEEFYEKMINNEIEYWTELESINLRYINGEYESYEEYQRALEECEKYYSQRRLEFKELTGIGALALQNNLNIEVEAATGKFVESELKKYAGLKTGVLNEHQLMKDRLLVFYSKELTPDVLDAIQRLTGATDAELQTFSRLVGKHFEKLKPTIINAITGIYGELDGSIKELNGKLTKLDLNSAIKPALENIGLLGNAWVTTSGLGDLKNLLLGSDPGGTDALATLMQNFADTSTKAKEPISECITKFTAAVDDAKNKALGDTLQTFADKVQAVSDSAKDLNNQLNDPKGVYLRFNDILNKIGQLTQKWEENGSVLQGVVDTYRELVELSEKKINAVVGINPGQDAVHAPLDKPEAKEPDGTVVKPGEQPPTIPADTTSTNIKQYIADQKNGGGNSSQCESGQQAGGGGNTGGGGDISTPQQSTPAANSAGQMFTVYNQSTEEYAPIAAASDAKSKGSGNYWVDTYGDGTLWSHPSYSSFYSGFVVDYYPGRAAPIHIVRNNGTGFGGGFFKVKPIADLNGMSEDSLRAYLENGNVWMDYAEKQGYKKKMKCLSSYDTGGYTGIWDDTGRLAVLHQKELVLNKDDTSNLLSAVDILRNIVSQLDLQALSTKLGLLSLTATAFTSPVGNETIDQNVKIEASFPNVSDRNEIEEAFSDLINTASQYANRKI